MSSTVQITLDTHAPQVTFGAESGTVAGELYRLAYTLDEPAIISATLHLADDRDLDMIDTGTELQVLLPPDTPTGNSTVHVLVRDSVLNSATRDHVAYLEGVVFEAPTYRSPGTSPGLPTAPTYPTRDRRRVTSRSMIHVSGKMKVRARSSDRSTATATTTAMIHATSSTASRALVLAAQRVQARLYSSDRSQITETVAIRKHPEGPNAEDELLLLDLL